MKTLALLLTVLGCVSCSSTTTESPSGAYSPNRSANLNSTLWVQTSAEYKATALQAYHSATLSLHEALIDKDWTAALEQKPEQAGDLAPAVVMDVDETVLDNSPYQAQRVLQGDHYVSATWDKWVAAARAKAVPGAVDFINQAQEQGVRVFFVSNRSCQIRAGSTEKCPQLADTMKNLRKVGIHNVSAEQILLKSQQPGWSSEKKSRREAIAQLYRIVMLVGDDLGDFLPGVKQDISVAQRQRLVQHYAPRWGQQWIMLPNPTYGSWQRVLGKQPAAKLQGTK